MHSSRRCPQLRRRPRTYLAYFATFPNTFFCSRWVYVANFKFCCLQAGMANHNFNQNRSFPSKPFLVKQKNPPSVSSLDNNCSVSAFHLFHPAPCISLLGLGAASFSIFSLLSLAICFFACLDKQSVYSQSYHICTYMYGIFQQTTEGESKMPDMTTTLKDCPKGSY